MATVLLEAQARTLQGKGASRRLRRLENKVPAVIYGGSKAAQSIYFLHNKVIKALESERIYSSVFDITVDGKVEHVILKDLQRHPYKSIIMHMDLQRVSMTEVLNKFIPLHFTNEENAKGVKAGGVISHTMTQVEVRCQAGLLPEFIEVDMTDVDLNDVVHLSSLKLPKGVALTVDLTDGTHDAPVVSIHVPKIVVEEEPVAEEAAEEGEGEVAAGEVPTVHEEQAEDKGSE